MSVRLATWNIHAWHTWNYRPSVDRMIEAVKEQKIDIIALEEVTDEFSVLTRFAEGTGLRHFVRCDIEFDVCNVICSRYPIQSSEFVSIGDERQAQFVTIDIPVTSEDGEVACETLRLVATHLDHIDERRRMSQWTRLREEVQRRWETRPFFVLGDFNVLRREDYSDAYWAEIVATREKSRWESPQTELLDALLAPRSAGGEGMIDSLRAGGDEAEARENVAGTCRFNTRIDYILLFPGPPSEATSSWKFSVGSYAVVPSSASDHSLVLVDIEMAAEERE